jgi:uncharacterized protein YqhQ
LKDIRRVFQYHGAEHKVVFAFESGKELKLENVRPFSTYHPRCGTSFLFITLIVAIILFALLDIVIIGITGGISLLQRIIFHIPFMPFIVGVGYELIKFTSKHRNNPVVGLFTLPGLWLQRITTRPPDELQMEVAIKALTDAFGDELNQYMGQKYIAEAIE